MFNEARTDFGILICSTTIGSLLLSFGLRYSLGIGAPSEMCGNGEEGAEEDHLLICCLCCLALRSYNTTTRNLCQLRLIILLRMVGYTDLIQAAAFRVTTDLGAAIADLMVLAFAGVRTAGAVLREALVELGAHLARVGTDSVNRQHVSRILFFFRLVLLQHVPHVIFVAVDMNRCHELVSKRV